MRASPVRARDIGTRLVVRPSIAGLDLDEIWRGGTVQPVVEKVVREGDVLEGVVGLPRLEPDDDGVGRAGGVRRLRANPGVA